MKKLTKSKTVKTPWGIAQTVQTVAPGIKRYTTATHGGFFVSPKKNSQILSELKDQTFGKLGLQGWYEEDIDWAVVAITFPRYFDDQVILTAKNTLNQKFNSQSD